jgi:cyclic beta-1,2-glucan synthetase
MADNARSRTAMDSVYARLVRRDQELIQLLDPPFDTSNLDPGYIRGYVPGVRENGGQYTHGAIWAVMAFATLDDDARAAEAMAMINPVNHGRTAKRIRRYRVEPYVVAADVYALAPHAGRGGWTWYTGSAGWMYCAIVESLLGLKREGARLRFSPHLPPTWNDLTVRYRYFETEYRISMHRRAATRDARRVTVTFDGVGQDSEGVTLVDDQKQHDIEVELFRESRVETVPSNSNH